MNIVILGKGSMGTLLSRLAAKAGHSVSVLGSQDDPMSALEAAGAYIVVIAMKYDQAMELLASANIATALVGKIVIDITNPLAPDFMSLTLGFETSAAEEIARCLPGAHVVKAFNTVFAGLLARRADRGHVGVPVFVAGNHPQAVERVMSLSREFGFETIHGGALTNSRYLEPMAEFMIQLGYSLGHGGEIGFGVVKAA